MGTLASVGSPLERFAASVALISSPAHQNPFTSKQAQAFIKKVPMHSPINLILNQR